MTHRGALAFRQPVPAYLGPHSDSSSSLLCCELAPALNALTAWLLLGLTTQLLSGSLRSLSSLQHVFPNNYFVIPVTTLSFPVGGTIYPIGGGACMPQNFWWGTVPKRLGGKALLAPGRLGGEALSPWGRPQNFWWGTVPKRFGGEALLAPRRLGGEALLAPGRLGGEALSPRGRPQNFWWGRTGHILRHAAPP